MLTYASDSVEFLQAKFGNEKNRELVEARAESNSRSYKFVADSDSFQVFVFEPNKSSFKASKRICACDDCLVSYGSCSLFKEYFPTVTALEKPKTRSEIQPDELEKRNEESSVMEGFTEGSFCAIAADYKSNETVWFVYIVGCETAKKKNVDKYGHVVHCGEEYLKCK